MAKPIIAQNHKESICIECGEQFIQFRSSSYSRCEDCRKNKKIRSNRKDITDQRFGKLVAIKINGFDKYGHLLWLFKCDCGKYKSMPTSYVTSSGVKSCGCSQGDGARCRKKEKIYVKCFYCGKEKLVHESRAQAYNKFFCHETNCRGKWMKENGINKGENSPVWKGMIKIPCAYCGKSLDRYEKRLETYPIQFCDPQCHGKWQGKNRTLHNNPNWNGGKSFEPYPLIWDEQLKEMIRDRDNRKCKLCSIQENGSKHPVHHIDYDKDNCDSSNLITLCHDCHVKTNFNRDYWKEHFQSQPSLALAVNQ